MTGTCTSISVRAYFACYHNVTRHCCYSFALRVCAGPVDNGLFFIHRVGAVPPPPPYAHLIWPLLRTACSSSGCSSNVLTSVTLPDRWSRVLSGRKGSQRSIVCRSVGTVPSTALFIIQEVAFALSISRGYEDYGTMSPEISRPLVVTGTVCRPPSMWNLDPSIQYIIK